MSKPTKTPEWATNAPLFDDFSGQPNVKEPPTSKKVRGWDYREKPPRNWLNWWMNLVYLWFDWLNKVDLGTEKLGHIFTKGITIQNDAGTTNVLRVGAPGSDGTLLISVAGGESFEIGGAGSKFVSGTKFQALAGLETNEADVRHGEYSVMLPASMGEPEATIGTGGLSSPTFYWTSTSAFNIQFPLPMGIGDRLKSVSVYIKDTGSTVTLKVYRSALPAGTGTQRGSTQTSAGNTTDQTLTVSGLTDTVADGQAFQALVTCPANALVYGAKLIFDRVA